MKKLTVYGLPLNPMSLLEQLKNASFCISFATMQDRAEQVEQAIELVGHDQILLLDNGAYSLFKKGALVSSKDVYLDSFEAWCTPILARCSQAIAVVPDVIGGTEEQNRELASMCMLDPDRCMAIWHMHESIDYLIYLCESFGYVGVGSSGDYWQVGTEQWHARMREAFAAIDQWEVDSEGAYIRPRLHLMRAQSMAHLYPFDSSDSTNVAMNHGRYRKEGDGHVGRFAARIDAKIQASAGPEAEHQAKRPLLFHVEAAEADAQFWLEMELARLTHQANQAQADDGLDIPDFLRRKAA